MHKHVVQHCTLKLHNLVCLHFFNPFSSRLLTLTLTTAVKLLYAQRWKDSSLPTMKEWRAKMMNLTQMAILTALIKEGHCLDLMMIRNLLLIF